MAAPHRVALVATAVLFLVVGTLPQGARAHSGLAGDSCSNDSECMSRTCGSDNACVATTCGMDPAKGGIGATMPAGHCSSSQFYNPTRVCTFGFGKCAKAECCDTLACGAGVPDLQKATYCPAGKAFAATRLCPGGTCTTTACCVQTRCDSAGGVAVARRATFCPSGFAFNNAGICAAGQGRCTADDCCALDTRACSIAFADPAFKLSCPAPSVLVPSRIYDATKANGGCCETKTCATEVPDAQKGSFCPSGYVFNGTPTCASGVCTTSDCCKSNKGFCDGAATYNVNTGACDCPANTSYVIGFGCACSAGKGLIGGVCTDCPYGTYSATPSAAQACSPCPTSQPYTANKGSNSADLCINYCDRELLSGSGACSNGGACTSLSGDPATGGAFSCTCPNTWMGYGATPSNNCDAPTTLLRLRVLAASGVTLPGGFQLLVSDVVNDKNPAYALQAPSLACSVSNNPTTPTVPVCIKGGAGALSLSASTTSGADTRSFVGTKVQLSTNYQALITEGKAPDADFVIEWACSDGVEASTPDMAIVLPGPANTNGAMTLVCTAIVSHAAMTTPVKLQLDPKSVVPVAASASSGAALLTFAQSGPICTLNMPAKAGDTAAAPECAYNEQPFESGKPGSLGVSNVDMEKYTVAWTCGANAVATDADGNAATPNLPSPGQAILICSANFQVKTTQVAFTVTSSAPADVQLTAMQKGMNEACTLTIPAGAKDKKDAALACPVSNLNSGVATTLTTNADLTKYLVSFTCTPSVGFVVKSRKSVVVDSTQNGQATPTSCTVVIEALPALLSLRIDNTLAKARDFKAFASQDASNTCVVNSDNQEVLCYLQDGMMPGVKTTLSPRALDANKYALLWSCTGATAANAFAQAQFSNVATVVLNANPNADGGLVTCVGTVASRDTPVTVYFDAATTAAYDALLPAAAEVRVRQPHQSKACAAVRPVDKTKPAAPVCDQEGLSASTQTTLSTGYVDLSKVKVTWSCSAPGSPSVATTLVAAGVSQATTQAQGTPMVCKATISPKPPLLTLASTGAGPSTAWSLSARQSSQGRACTVDVAASSSSTAAAAPACAIQPLMPSRATVLSTAGLDSSRYSVTWSCTRADGSAVALADSISSSGVLVANAKTVTLDKDANANGGPIACTAAIAARDNVLVLAATGDLPKEGGWSLTAQQSTQSKACSVGADTAGATDVKAGAAPSCDAGVLAFAAGAPVQLGATGFPASSIVTWACTARDMASAVSVDNGNAGVASLTPPAGTVTFCTATVVGQKSAFFQIVADKGVTFSAFQGVGEAGAKAMCTVTSDIAGKAQVCDGATATTATTLVATLDEGMAADTIVRFSCKLGSNGAPMPVSKSSGLSATVMSPPAVETILCTASVVGKPPILTVTSNFATVLTAVSETKAVCTSTAATNKLVCDAGAGTGQLPAKVRVNLSQQGLTAKGYYRWSCSSTAAEIVRSGDQTVPSGDNASTATITLPEDGKSLTCSLTYTVDEPKLGRRRLARLLLL